MRPVFSTQIKIEAAVKVKAVQITNTVSVLSDLKTRYFYLFLEPYVDVVVDGSVLEGVAQNRN